MKHREADKETCLEHSQLALNLCYLLASNKLIENDIESLEFALDNLEVNDIPNLIDKDNIGYNPKELEYCSKVLINRIKSGKRAVLLDYYRYDKRVDCV